MLGKKPFKDIFIYIIIGCLVVMLVFSFNRAKVVKADPISAIGIGSSLAAIVAAYFATSGISLTSSASNDGGSFLGNYVANWVKGSSSFANNTYFNSDGEFIGTDSDLGIVQNNDTGVVSLLFGQEFAIWLEALKESFVSDNSLTYGSTKILVNQDGFVNQYNQFFPVLSSSSVTPDFTLIPSENNTYTYDIGDYYIECSKTIDAYQNRYRIGASIYLKSRTDSSFSRSYLLSRGDPVGGTVARSYYENIKFNFGINDNGYLIFYWSQPGDVPSRWISSGTAFKFSNFGANVSSISLDGSLTDGYEDFEDAINQDLDSENEDLVVGLDVGAYPDTLNPSALLDSILAAIHAGTFEGEYTGTYENMDEAEQEKEGEKEFVPELPVGWVTVDGLEDFFPFCIPFDLYALLDYFDAEPVAPVIRWNMGFGGVFDPEEVVLDFSPWETAAIIFRVIVVIGFLIFLILKTRDLIRG